MLSILQLYGGRDWRIFLATGWDGSTGGTGSSRFPIHVIRHHSLFPRPPLPVLGGAIGFSSRVLFYIVTKLSASKLSENLVSERSVRNDLPHER